MYKLFKKVIYPAGLSVGSHDKCLNLIIVKKLDPSSKRFMKYTHFNEEGKVGGLIAVLPPPQFNNIRHRKPILTVSTGMSQDHFILKKPFHFALLGGGSEPPKY